MQFAAPQRTSMSIVPVLGSPARSDLRSAAADEADGKRDVHVSVGAPGPRVAGPDERDLATRAVNGLAAALGGLEHGRPRHADRLNALHAIHVRELSASEKVNGPTVREPVTPEDELTADAAVLTRRPTSPISVTS